MMKSTSDLTEERKKLVAACFPHKFFLFGNKDCVTLSITTSKSCH